jgi:hypothetical protein
MPNPSKSVEAMPGEPVVACSICLAEIPHSVAKSHEGAEYVYYFCGDACYAQWEAEAEGADSSGPQRSAG